MKRGRPWTLKLDADAKPFSGRYRGHKIAGEDWKGLQTERARIDRYWSAKIAAATNEKERGAVLEEELRLTRGSRDILLTVKASQPIRGDFRPEGEKKIPEEGWQGDQATAKTI
jgi:hypothetical protein